jgi:hypothetical protein
VFLVDSFFDLLMWLTFDPDGNKWVMPILVTAGITFISAWVYVEIRLMKND